MFIFFFAFLKLIGDIKDSLSKMFAAAAALEVTVE